MLQVLEQSEWALFETGLALYPIFIQSCSSIDFSFRWQCLAILCRQIQVYVGHRNNTAVTPVRKFALIGKLFNHKSCSCSPDLIVLIKMLHVMSQALMTLASLTGVVLFWKQLIFQWVEAILLLSRVGLCCATCWCRKLKNLGQHEITLK